MKVSPLSAVSYTDDCTAPPIDEGRRNTTIALPGAGVGSTPDERTIIEDWHPASAASVTAASIHLNTLIIGISPRVMEILQWHHLYECRAIDKMRC